LNYSDLNIENLEPSAILDLTGSGCSQFRGFRVTHTLTIFSKIRQSALMIEHIALSGFIAGNFDRASFQS